MKDDLVSRNDVINVIKLHQNNALEILDAVFKLPERKHDIKTYKDVLLEQFPDVVFSKYSGLPSGCRLGFFHDETFLCTGICAACWDEEYKE